MRKYAVIASALLIIAGVLFLIVPWQTEKKLEQKQDEILTAIQNGTADIAVSIQPDDTEMDTYGYEQTEEAELIEEVTSVNGIGVLEIESIDLKLPVLEGATNATLKVGLGRVSESAEVGEVGNCIIAGHRKYTYGDMFNRLDEVKVGDIIRFTSVNGEAMSFKVYATTVILPNDYSLFEVAEGQTKLTLLTCTPVRKATHRLLVLANLMDE